MNDFYKDPIEIAKNIYWVGKFDLDTGFYTNPYLIIDKDEAIIIDPGSVLDFETVYKKVTSLTPIESIKYIILNHQDPDLCASVPLFENKGCNSTIVTHWRSSLIIKHYGVKSPFYLVNENSYQLGLKSGRKLQFIFTPYLHFPGAIVTYDTKTKILFSSDLFGALSSQKNRDLFADDTYEERMKAFHEHYMPSNDIIRPVMNTLLKFDISMIAPQHGSIIKESVKNYIKILRDLECGNFLFPIKKELAKTGGYTEICNQILKRYYSIVNIDEIKEIFKNTHIIINEDTGRIDDFNSSGEELWNQLFDIISERKGIKWITMIETLVEKIVKEYDIDYPTVYKSHYFKIEREVKKLKDENKKLELLYERTQEALKKTDEKLTKCPVTGLYNEKYFFNYLKTDVEHSIKDNINFSLFLISIDNIYEINNKFGEKKGDETLKDLAYLIKNIKNDAHIIFRGPGPSIVYYIPHIENREQIIKISENIRNQVYESNIFITDITVSIGIIYFEEFINILTESDYKENIPIKIYNTLKRRVSIAKNRGMNTICDSSSLTEMDKELNKKILLVENDKLNVEIIKNSLDVISINIINVDNGIDALAIIEKEHPILIISELMIPKLDAFRLRKRMLASSILKDIPFILLSYSKNDEDIIRAYSLNIDYYIQKPYNILELTEIVKNKINSITNN